MRAYRKWIAAAGIAEGPVFRAFRNRTMMADGITDRVGALTLKRAAERAGIPAVHSPATPCARDWPPPRPATARARRPSCARANERDREHAQKRGGGQISITPNGAGGYVIALQADRLGTGTGRVYTLNATATDLAGNTARVTATHGSTRPRIKLSPR